MLSGFLNIGEITSSTHQQNCSEIDCNAKLEYFELYTFTQHIGVYISTSQSVQYVRDPRPCPCIWWYSLLGFLYKENCLVLVFTKFTRPLHVNLKFQSVGCLNKSHTDRNPTNVTQVVSSVSRKLVMFQSLIRIFSSHVTRNYSLFHKTLNLNVKNILIFTWSCPLVFCEITNSCFVTKISTSRDFISIWGLGEISNSHLLQQSLEE